MIQAGEDAPAFGGAIPSASASSVSSSDDSTESPPSFTDSSSSVPSSTDSRGGENGGRPDEDAPEGRDAMDAQEAAPETPNAPGAPVPVGTTGAPASSATQRPKRDARAPNKGPVSLAARQERNLTFFNKLVEEWRGKVGVVPGWTEERVADEISCIQGEWDEALRKHELKVEEERLQRELDEQPCLACGKNDDTINALLCDKPIGGGRTCDNVYHVKCAGLKRKPSGDVSEFCVGTHLEKVAPYRNSDSAYSPRPTHRIYSNDHADQIYFFRIFSRCLSVSVVLPKVSRES